MIRNSSLADVPALEDALRPFFISSATAVSIDGFHTPNHRWVRTAALSQVAELYPELDFDAAIELFLAEGIDVNSDGQYSERSNGSYNAVCNTHLIQTAEAAGRREILDSVRRNLILMHQFSMQM